MEKVTIGDKSLNCSQWAKELGVTRGAISFRKMKFGETAEEAVTHFYNKRKYGGGAYRLRCLLGSALFTLDDLVIDDKFLAQLEDVVSSIRTVIDIMKIIKDRIKMASTDMDIDYKANEESEKKNAAHGDLS